MPYERERQREIDAGQSGQGQATRTPICPPQMNHVEVEWEIIDAHIVLRAACRKGVFHSYAEAMAMLRNWADGELKEAVYNEIERQVHPPKKEKLDKDCPTP